MSDDTQLVIDFEKLADQTVDFEICLSKNDVQFGKSRQHIPIENCIKTK